MKKVITFIIGVAITLLGLFLTATHGHSQPGVRPMLSSYNLSSDTTVNTGTSYLQLKNSGVAQTVTVQFNATKISGTVAGTVTLMGSLDGTNFKALTQQEVSTAIPTFTATDVATQSNIWVIKNNPYQYYRVSWTGTGTMSAKFSALLMTH